ncbi:MAG: hypothetical protein FJ009_18930 [Chloroflexi bacterium]|nr:hypothetical protein [Chloroflexota bacterium]
MKQRGGFASYEFTPLTHTDARGASYTIGHAIIWDPRRVRMELIVSRETLARDFYTTAFAPYYKQIEPWKTLAPIPALGVREAIEQCPGGIAYFNAGESGALINPLIENGRLLTKIGTSRALGQTKWELLNDAWTFFLQHADGRAEIRDLRIVDNQIHPDDLKYLQSGTNSFSVPHILKRGARVPLKNPPPGRTALSGETLCTIGAPAALSAIGLTADARVVRIALIGDVTDPTNWDRIGTEDDLIRYLRDFGVTDALFAGASGDVQTYDAPSQMLAVAAERPKIESKRWVLKPGQTERGVTCIVKLVDG